MRELKTYVNNKEYEKIKNYCEKHKISIYELVKNAVFEKTGVKRIEGG